VFLAFDFYRPCSVHHVSSKKLAPAESLRRSPGGYNQIFPFVSLTYASGQGLLSNSRPIYE